MLDGIGVDLILLKRMQDTIETGKQVFLEAVFSPWEQQKAAAQDNPLAYYAKLFAAKEAVFKAFGITWDTGVKLSEVEIRDGAAGEPAVGLTGRFAEIAAERKFAKILLSVSYDGDYAMAVAAAVAAVTIGIAVE